MTKMSVCDKHDIRDIAKDANLLNLMSISYIASIYLKSSYSTK